MDAVTMTEVMSAVGSVGFPIVCCWYFMTTVNKQLTANTEAINGLKETLSLFIQSQK